MRCDAIELKTLRNGMYMVRRGGGIDPVVDLLSDEVYAEGDEGDAKAGGGVTELIGEHRMLPPRVPPPEELCRVPSCSRSHFPLSSFSPTSESVYIFDGLGPIYNSLAQAQDQDEAQLVVLFHSQLYSRVVSLSHTK